MAKLTIALFILSIFLFRTINAYADVCSGYQTGDSTHSQQQGKCFYYSPTAPDNFSTNSNDCGLISCHNTQFPTQDTCNYMAHKAGLSGNFHGISDILQQCVFNNGGPYYCCAPDVQPSPSYPPPPCTSSGKDKSICTSVDTGFGTIQVDPGSVVGTLFGALLGLAGGIALVLIIFSGYQIIFAQADPEKLTAARERLTSAIIGLLFIIFSITILQIIGVDILHLPGLNR